MADRVEKVYLYYETGDEINKHQTAFIKIISATFINLINTLASKGKLVSGDKFPSLWKSFEANGSMLNYCIWILSPDWRVLRP